jgi:hypothetical protein
MGNVYLTVNRVDVILKAEKPMKETKEKKRKTSFSTPLYRHVFYGRFSTVVVFMLLGSMLLQPIDRAHASETETAPLPVPIDTATVTAETPPAEESATDTVSPTLITQATAATDTSATVQLTPETSSTTTEASSTVAEETTEPTPLVMATTTATDTSAEIDTVSNPQPTVSPPELNLQSGSATSTVIHNDVVSSDISSTSSSTSPESQATSTGETTTVKATVTSDSEIQFDKTDCVAVSDGSYYCHTKTPVPTTAVKDGLYSQPDADGDLEIYFAKDGVLKQITHNTVDDASPYYDSISNTIVWHRLINDRYQIISYDVKSGAESQLTTDTVNNMEPTRAGKYTVWQHWNKNNWDIMLNDSATTRLLTTTPEHDIAPTIRGNLVMWNRLTSDKKQTIELYDLTTGEYTTIHDDEGGALSNPRMVLVYDAKFKNGDVVTKGYDVVTGKITPLSATPASVPDKIPAPDKTGETRALIQAKSTTREDTEQIGAPKPTIDPPAPVPSSTSTLEASSTLNLQQSATTLTLIAQPPATTTLFTLDLSSTSSLQIVNSDVVVPPFVASSTPRE